MFRANAFRVLPLRALAQKKKKVKKQQPKSVQQHQAKLVPYLPAEVVKDTTNFFNNERRFKALLELVFSPLEPKDTEEDREEYEVAKAEFDTLAERARLAYEAHEKKAMERMWKAVHQLPEDLYDEAVQSRPEPVPESLLFHERHRDTIFNGLDDMELRRLQCYQNLMYIRYPHLEERRLHPERFLIPESQVVSRQKEAAMAKKKIKKR
mmetsp:Transcript_67416/g.161713  ORF Transcript_67416/g.161713 Transcript_67416/m.161713 type:complete len:209 (+) Transcript_67416:54-680(+)